MRQSHALLLLAALAGVLLCGGAACAEELITVKTRTDVTQSFYLTKPAAAPVASLILFTGGDGRLPNNYGPANMKRGNFLVRSRDLFVEQGFTVAVVNAPSDESSGMRAFRLSEEHRADIAAVIAYL